MKDQYYGDHRDLVKWGALLHLAQVYGLQRIIQVAYWRNTEWAPIEIDGTEYPLPEPVIHHFRSVRNIVSLTGDPAIQVLDSTFSDCDDYLREISDSRTHWLYDTDTRLRSLLPQRAMC